MEYSSARQKRMAQASQRARNAIPAAGPVTVTKIDGTVEVLPPKEGTGVDVSGEKPHRRHVAKNIRKPAPISKLQGKKRKPS
jgi:hypothetical protein